MKRDREQLNTFQVIVYLMKSMKLLKYKPDIHYLICNIKWGGCGKITGFTCYMSSVWLVSKLCEFNQQIQI